MEEITLAERLGHDWVGHPVSFAHPLTAARTPGTAIAVRDLAADILLAGQVGQDGRLWLLADLPAYAEKRYLPEPDAALPASDLRVEVTDTDFRLSSQFLTAAVPKVDRVDANGLTGIPAPLNGIVGLQGERRGRGEWAAAQSVVSVRSQLTAKGPVFAEARVEYQFADGTHYWIAWRVFSQAQAVIAEEDKTVSDAGTWRFSLSDNFTPDTAHLSYGERGQWPLAFAAGEHVCRHLFFNHWSLYQDFKDLSFVYDSRAGHDADAVGLFPVNGDSWTHVASSIISLDTTTAPDVRYSFSLTPGFRSFALFALTQRQTAQGVEDVPGAGAYALQARWSQARLEDVKEMTLDWPEPKRTRPWLYTTPERLATLTARVREETDTYGDLGVTSALFSDDPKVVQATKEAFFQDAERMTRHALSAAPNGANVNTVMLRPLLTLPLFHEILQMREALTEEEDRRARALMAFLAYYTSREDYYFGRYSLLPEGHPDNIMGLYKGMRSENMNVDRFLAIGMIGLALPGHPRAATWRQFALEGFDECMTQLVAPCGAWCEGVNYYWWSLRLFLHYAQVMKHQGADLFAHPKFRAMIGFVVQSLSPRRPDRQGRRIAPGFGSYGESLADSGYGSLMAQAAFAYSDTDPEFSAHLMWAFQETGEGLFTRDPQIDGVTEALFTDLDLPAKAPALTSQGCPGFGTIFRHTHEDGQETFLIARASPFWPHHHIDPGSFFLYFRDAPLITEARHGRGPKPGGHAAPPAPGSGSAHNIIRFDGKDLMQYVWPNRQGLVHFAQTETLEYAVLDCRQEALIRPGEKRRGHGDDATIPVDIRHFRHIIFLKPDIFVLYDTVHNAPFRSDYRLWTDSERVEFFGNRALVTGRYGVDMEIVVVQPTEPQFQTAEAEDTRLVEFPNDPDGDYLIVLHAREAGSDAPTVCRFENGVLSIFTGDKSHQVHFRPTDRIGVYDVVRTG